MKIFNIFFLAILLFASCATSRYSEAEIERFKKIESPLERWDAHKITNYNYTIKFNPSPYSQSSNYKVFVQNSQVEKVFNIKKGTWILPPDAQGYETITWKIMKAHGSLIMSRDSSLNIRCRVDFDEIYGYPIEVHYEEIFCGHCYYSYEIYDFEY